MLPVLHLEAIFSPYGNEKERGWTYAIINDPCGRAGHGKKGRRQGRNAQVLENLGFVAGSDVTVISEINGNIIVNVKDSRVAIGKDMANKILV